MDSYKEFFRNTGSAVMGHIGAMAAVAMWGLSFVSTKVIMEEGHLSPTEAYIYRFIIAYLIILFIAHKRLFCDNWRDEGLMALVGICAGSIYFIAENTALQYTLTANVSLLTSTSPLITVLLVALIYRNEKLGAGLITGSCVAFVGVACVIFNSSTSVQINPLGDLLAIGASFSWAVYSLILKRLNVTYDAMFITRKTFFYGIVTAIPFMLFEPTLINPFHALANPLVLGNLLFLALGASICGYYLWALTVKKMGAVKANNYMYFQPVVTLIAGALALGEHISMLGYAGFALILFCLWLGDYLQRRLAMRK